MADFLTRPLSNRRRKDITSLQHRKYRARHGETIVEGTRAVTSAIEAGAPVTDVVLTSDMADRNEIMRPLETLSGEIPIWIADDADMSDVSGVDSPQGVLAVVERQYADTATVVEAETTLSESEVTLLALDGVQDPGNVGTIIRTAAWFGVSAIVAGPGTAGLFGPKVMRAAMGGHWDLSLARTDTLGETLDTCRHGGFPIYGADLYGTGAGQWAPHHPSVLVLGSEAHGLSAAVLDRLDEPVAIPGAPNRQGAESLNVAIASGILVYEWMNISG